MSLLPQTKQCNKCKGIFPKTEEYFYKNSNCLGFRKKCRECHKNQIPSRASYAYKNKKHKEKYGISLEEVKILLEIQNYKCKICGTDIIFPQGKGFHNDPKAAQTDHDHISGKTRGLICRKCNVGLGAFKDDCLILNNAIKYLRSYE